MEALNIQCHSLLPEVKFYVSSLRLSTKSVLLQFYHTHLLLRNLARSVLRRTGVLLFLNM